jgi:hypothetical protein
MVHKNRQRDDLAMSPEDSEAAGHRAKGAYPLEVDPVAASGEQNIVSVLIGGKRWRHGAASTGDLGTMSLDDGDDDDDCGGGDTIRP